MDRSDDIQFLEKFRKLVDKYLFLGYSPGDFSDGSESMDEALESVEFQALRRNINEMKFRVSSLANECGTNKMMNEYPPPAVGGAILRIPMLDLITANPLSSSVTKHEFFDLIDQTIGVLKTNPPKKVETESRISASKVRIGFVFIAMPMSPDDPHLVDVHEAIKETARDIGLIAERIDEPISTARITDRIIESLETAEYVVADLTHGKPNVYYEAGYAHALGKTPIYIARAGTTIEFDLKDYPVTFFKNFTELKKELHKSYQD